MLKLSFLPLSLVKKLRMQKNNTTMIPLFLLAFLSLNLPILASNKKESEVVIGLNLKKYAGRWYEIASLPSPFVPRNSVNTRATYTLNNNGTVHVLNEAWSNGKKFSTEGILYKADPNSDEAKFKVKFIGVPAAGDYWVLYIDRNYQYALVGHPEKKYLWILSRQTRLANKIYERLFLKAAGEGYDVYKLQKTPQAADPPH